MVNVPGGLGAGWAFKKGRIMKKFVTAIAILMPLTSCSLWNDYEHPTTDLPKDFTGKTDKTPAAWPDAEWWKQFNSPQLTKLVEAAKDENYDLKAAAARVREADAEARIAGAALLPSVDASGGATRSHSPSGSSSSGRSSYVNKSYNATLSASYELDFWGKNWSAEQSASALAEGSRYDQETIFLSTISSVANTYFNILVTKERLQISNDNLKTAQSLLTSIQKRQKAGIVSALDVAQQESVVDNQATQIPQLELQLTQYKNALAILVGRMPEDLKIPATKLEDVALPVVGVGLPSELLQRRPDVQSAEAQLISAHANIINARAQLFPDISLTADGGYASAALSNLFKPGSSLFSLGASVTQPIFEGGRLFAQIDYSKARYDELLQNYKKTVVAAFSDVENALAGAEQNKKEEAASAQAAKTALLAFNLTQRQYKSGIVDITTVLNTQRTLFAAQDSLLQAKLAHLQSTIGLYQALGGGWTAAKVE